MRFWWVLIYFTGVLKDAQYTLACMFAGLIACGQATGIYFALVLILGIAVSVTRVKWMSKRVAEKARANPGDASIGKDAVYLWESWVEHGRTWADTKMRQRAMNAFLTNGVDLASTERIDDEVLQAKVATSSRMLRQSGN
jgi:hypothetical protein